MRLSRREADLVLESLLNRLKLAEDAARPLSTLLDLLTQPEAPTTIHDPMRAVYMHVGDSLAGLGVSELREARTIADLGSGAGLPGLVLAAVLPTSTISLVEASRRTCEFLRAAVQAMGLRNVHVLWSRAEEWRDGLGKCDAVSARALASLPVVCEYAAPLLRDGGSLVAWKGDVAEPELADAAAAATHLGLAVASVRRVTPYPDAKRLTLHVFEKVAPTPARYPRRPGMAVKRPLSVKTLR